MTQIYNHSLTINDAKDQSKLPSFSLYLGRKITIFLGTIPVNIVRIMAIVLNVFGRIGKEFSKRVHDFADKLHAILVVHPSNGISHLFEHTLHTFSKNIARKDVIWKGEDLKKSKDFLSRLTDPNYIRDKGFGTLTNEELVDLKKSHLKGSVVGGVCFGASLAVIKLLLSSNLQNEQDLKNRLKQFEEGFSDEVAGLQSMHAAFIGYDFELNQKDQEEITNKGDKLREKFFEKKEQMKANLVEAKKTLSPQEYQAKITEVLQELQKDSANKIFTFGKKLIEITCYQRKSHRVNIVASLIDLKLKTVKYYKNAHFAGIHHKKKQQEKFNNLKNGYYQLCFKADEKGGHSIVYIKQDFGCYLFDPNFGLYKCSSTNPAESVCELFKKFYPGKKLENNHHEHSLEIFHY